MIIRPLTELARLSFPEAVARLRFEHDDQPGIVLDELERAGFPGILRMGDRIWLSLSQKRRYYRLTGIAFAPFLVSDFNRELEEAALVYDLRARPGDMQRARMCRAMQMTGDQPRSLVWQDEADTPLIEEARLLPLVPQLRQAWTPAY